MAGKILKSLVIVAIIVLIAVAGIFLYLEIKMRSGAKELEAIYQSHETEKISKAGTTSMLRVTPLVDWHSDNDALKTEMGVSYLVETDSLTILFDLGLNKQQEVISPLQHNMNELGVQVDQIDAIYITHNHLDHVGGKQFMDNQTFGINPSQETNLSEKKIYSPIDMSYPKGQATTTNKPFVLAPGVASIGSIPRQLFLGRIDEQSLAVNVEGKGIVLLVGCAHQTIPKIIERTQALFDEPIYGIIGGLHLPVPEGRWKIAGLDLQRIQSGKGPLDPIAEEDVDRYFKQFKELDMKFISIGGHDSSDEMIQKAKETFGGHYHELKVGRQLEI